MPEIVKRIIRILGVFVFMPLAIWFFPWQEEPKPSTALDRKPADLEPAPKPAAVIDETIAFHPIARQRYTYNFERRILLEGFGNRSPAMGYHGELYIDVLSSSAAGFEALVSERVAEFSQKKALLLRVFVDARGESLKIFSAELRTDLEREHANVLRDLLANWVFPLREDTVGIYQSRIEAMPPQSGLLRKKKTKLSYSSARNPIPEIVTSQHSLLWDPGLGMPKEVRGEESTRLGKGSMSLASTNNYLIYFSRVGASPAVSKAQLKQMRVAQSLVLSPTKQNLADNPEYASLRWPSLVAQLENLNKMNTEEQLRVFGDLVRMLRLNGAKTVADAAALLTPDVIRQGASSELFKAVVGALATVGGAEAEAALRGIYQDGACPISGKGAVLSALTTTQANLEASTRDFLATVMRSENNVDLSNGAAFALGSALQNAPADASAARAIHLLGSALALQGKANNTAEQMAILDAIGNSGRSEFFPQLRDIANGQGDSALRARAVFSTRFIKTDSATLLLLQSLGNANPQIREAAVAAVGLAAWNEQFRAPLLTCSTSDPESRIQNSCKEILQHAAGIIASSN